MAHKKPVQQNKPQVERSARVAWLVAVLLALGSFVLFAWNITRPAEPYFDETHYVAAARALLERLGPVNIEHPLFAKTMIAAGMLLFGNDSLGWRLPNALFAAIAVAALFWVALLLLRDLKAAILAALLLVFNQTHFIQARIAMLEMPMTAMILIGGGCFLQAREAGPGARRWEYLGAIALGLAIGAKWLAVPYAALFLGAAGWAKLHARKHDPAFVAGHVIADVGKLGLVMLAAYFVTFWPAFFYARNPMTLNQLIGFQSEMLRSQSGNLAPHPYQSAWWTWPLMLRPVWYLFAKSANNYEAVLLIGNPVVYWGGLAVVLAWASGWMKQRTPQLNAMAGLWAFSIGIWALIPKRIGFFYYYNLSAVVLCLVIAAFFASWGARGVRILGVVTALAAAMFAYFYPIISAQPLPTDDTWTRWVWMKSWY